MPVPVAQSTARGCVADLGRQTEDIALHFGQEGDQPVDVALDEEEPKRTAKVEHQGHEIKRLERHGFQHERLAERIAIKAQPAEERECSYDRMPDPDLALFLKLGHALGVEAVLRRCEPKIAFGQRVLRRYACIHVHGSTLPGLWARGHRP